jgi:hypothetical protein
MMRFTLSSEMRIQPGHTGAHIQLISPCESGPIHSLLYCKRAWANTFHSYLCFGVHTFLYFKSSLRLFSISFWDVLWDSEFEIHNRSESNTLSLSVHSILSVTGHHEPFGKHDALAQDCWDIRGLAPSIFISSP